MQLERRLKEQQDSYQRQLASFLVVNAFLRVAKRCPNLTSPGQHHPPYGCPARPTESCVVRIHRQLLPTQTQPTVAWGAPIGEIDAFTPEELGPRVAGIRRHLGITARSCYPQLRGSTCDAPNPGGSLITRQLSKDSWMSGNPTPHH